MSNYTDLYKELCDIAETNIPALKWQDMWRNQVGFLEEEDPFPSPALFYSFYILSTEDMGGKVQKVRMQVTMRLFFETFADSYHGAFNQGDALAFLDILTKLFAIFHGSNGETYSEMRRVGMGPDDMGGTGNLYQQTFECICIDDAAKKLYEDANVNDIDIQKGNIPQQDESEQGTFYIPMR